MNSLAKSGATPARIVAIYIDLRYLQKSPPPSLVTGLLAEALA